MSVALIEIVKKTLSVASALLTGKDVGPDRLRKRLEICAACQKSKRVGDVMRCGICKCKLKEQGLINLARFEETGGYGCKFPGGSRWKLAGV